MSGNRFLDWFFRLLFPAVLTGVIGYSILVQPPLISSPEVKAGFAGFGSRPGYLEYVEPQTGPWPGSLHPLLLKALVRSFGPSRPLVESFYYFGTANRELWGLKAPVGFEALLLPGSGYSRQTSLSAFNFHLALWQTGMRADRAWFKKNGAAGPADPDKAQAAYLLEQAALLLPLAGDGFVFEDNGPNRIKAGVGQGRVLELEFSHDRLLGAAIGENRIRVEHWVSFRDYLIPSHWSGRWGQEGLSAMEIQGLVLNPPFAEEAMDSAAR